MASGEINYDYNAASVASLMITTEARIAELPREEKAPAGCGMDGMGVM